MPSKQLLIIRVALITGVFLFAGVSVYLRAVGGSEATQAVANLPVGTLRYVLWGLVVACGAAVFVLRPRAEVAPPALRGTLTIVGWTLGEGVALFGIILHFAGADISTLALGLLSFIFALVLLPVPRRR